MSNKLLLGALIIVLLFIGIDLFLLFKHPGSPRITTQPRANRIKSPPPIPTYSTSKQVEVISESPKIQIASYDERKLQDLLNTFKVFQGENVVIPLPKRTPSNVISAPLAVSSVMIVLTDTNHPISITRDNTESLGMAYDAQKKHLVLRVYTSVVQRMEDKKQLVIAYQNAIIDALRTISKARLTTSLQSLKDTSNQAAFITLK